MNDSMQQLFLKLISHQIGLNIREQDHDKIWQNILARMKEIHIDSANNYYQILSSDTETSKKEWQELFKFLTVNESYFLRDKGQFSLLRHTILPELIQRQRHRNKSLRIWSAGCSTGEEPYSLAILIKELIPDIEQWQIFILGTDIYQQVIQQAEKGIYRDWSFRISQDNWQKSYFKPCGNGWQINPEIRKIVKFKTNNLVQDIFPDRQEDIYDFDLILCRNVFVYFDYKTIALVMNKFHNCLKNQGYLITSHAEVCGQDYHQFKVIIFPESLVYQKFDKDVNYPRTPVINYPSLIKEQKFHVEPKKIDLLPSVPHDNQYLLQEAEKLFYNKDYLGAITKAEEIIAVKPKDFAACYLLAQIYANLGQYEQAQQFCQRAIDLNYSAIPPYYLLVNIAEETNDVEFAKILLKKIIYLAPDSVLAYVQLGDIHEKQQQKQQAKKMYHAALQVLSNLPGNAFVELPQTQVNSMTVSELVQFLKSKLEK